MKLYGNKCFKLSKFRLTFNLHFTWMLVFPAELEKSIGELRLEQDDTEISVQEKVSLSQQQQQQISQVRLSHSYVLTAHSRDSFCVLLAM